jgi:outer membrane biosynthesis protein TonB
MKGIRQRARVQPLGGAGLAGTLTIHLAVVITFVAAGMTRPTQLAPIAYRVSLVAAPPPSAAAATAAPARAEPPAPTPAPAPVRDAVPLRDASAPARAPAPQAPARAAASAASARAAPAATSAVPGPPGSTTAGTDAATIRTEGVEFPFPGYLRNLVAQVYQRWRPPASQAALVAEVFFFIHRDGSVAGLQFIRRSGSFAFDLETQGAIESAARAGAFGALPDGFGADVLPVSFFFNPRGR